MGQEYTFIQADRSNHYHPLAFTAGSNRFYQGETQLTKEQYKKKFFEALHDWSAYENFSVRVQLDASVKASSATFYCIIHSGMEGSIQLFPEDSRGSNAITQATTDIPEYVDNRSEFDKKCGTYGLGDFELPNALCPDRFVCGTEDVTDELKHFAECLEAANCHMMSGMTTGVSATADAALFIHQMIPHHQNAVNTAKTLLKMGSLLCPDMTDKSNPDCVLEGILREIVAGQNHQIELMRKFLRDHDYPMEDNCDVYVKTIEREEEEAVDMGPKSSGAGSRIKTWSGALLALTGSFYMLA